MHQHKGIQNQLMFSTEQDIEFYKKKIPASIDITRFHSSLIINIKVGELDVIWNDLGIACKKKQEELAELVDKSYTITQVVLLHSQGLIFSSILSFFNPPCSCLLYRFFLSRALPAYISPRLPFLQLTLNLFNKIL